MDAKKPSLESGDPELQFEKAEFSQAAGHAVCQRCGLPLGRSYYQSGSQVVCEPCKFLLEQEAALGTGPDPARLLRSLAFGIPAAAVGAGIYYAISAATGYEFGLVAIVIGLMVGAAVRAGSRRRGGWLYQGLAMFLTYNAILATYVPAFWQSVQEAEQEQASVAAPPEGDVSSDPATATTLDLSAPLPPADPLAEGGTQEAELGVDGCVLAGLTFMAIFYASPFLAGFENFMGWIIIGIGLYEAWKLNKRQAIEISGPFDLVATPPTPEHAA